jgi:FkbM family methyltransferase
VESSNGLFKKNKIVSVTVIISCLLFVGIFFLEKSRYIIDLIPTLRGEISLDGNIIITTTKNKLPILIRKDDPFIANQLRFFGSVKSDFAEIADSLCKSTDIVVEIGSYFGYNSVTLGNKLKGNGKLYGFEPNTHIFSFLKKSIMLNNLENTVILRNVAISDKRGTCNINDIFHIAKTQDGSLEKPRCISVDCVSIDEEMKNINKPIDLLLIDIPGYEFQIITGAADIIKKSPNIAIMVMFDQQESSQSVNVHTEIQNLIRQGFRFYWCDNNRKIHPMKATPEDVIGKNKAILIITKKQL